MSIEQLVVDNARWIRCKAFQLCRDDRDADDLAGETIYKCLRYGERFDDNRDFRPLALSILTNTFITLYNRRMSVRFSEYADDRDYISSGGSDESARVKQLLDIIAECRKRYICIDTVMLFAEGYSYEEIATIQSLPVGTVKSRISASRKILRVFLEC